MPWITIFFKKTFFYELFKLYNNNNYIYYLLSPKILRNCECVKHKCIPYIPIDDRAMVTPTRQVATVHTLSTISARN